MTKPYDKTKIGRFIGWGGEHLVFLYDTDKVIKFSLHVCLSGRVAVEKIKEDYVIGKKYFGDYVLDTEIMTWQDGKRCAEIQPYLTLRFLQKRDLADPLIKRQFDDIMQSYYRMERETGEVFDIFGREGLFRIKPVVMSNILVTPDSKLVLSDFSIIGLKKIKIREVPVWLFMQWAKRRQKKLLSNFIK